MTNTIQFPKHFNRSLHIGINYRGQNGELQGCIGDVDNLLAKYDELGITSGERKVLTDDTPVTPTRANMLEAMNWLVQGAKPGDKLFLQYSGHGSYQHGSKSEKDGRDETLVPLDYMQSGDILDDLVNETLVAPLPAGSLLILLCDCCHSGTNCDLPFQFIVGGDVSNGTLPPQFGSQQSNQVPPYEEDYYYGNSWNHYEHWHHYHDGYDYLVDITEWYYGYDYFVGTYYCDPPNDPYYGMRARVGRAFGRRFHRAPHRLSRNVLYFTPPNRSRGFFSGLTSGFSNVMNMWNKYQHVAMPVIQDQVQNGFNAQNLFGAFLQHQTTRGSLNLAPGARVLSTRRQVRAARTDGGQVISFSGCRDDQVSLETSDHQGAMTKTFLGYLNELVRAGTSVDLNTFMNEFYTRLNRGGFEQRPQICSTNELTGDTQLCFNLT